MDKNEFKYIYDKCGHDGLYLWSVTTEKRTYVIEDAWLDMDVNFGVVIRTNHFVEFLPMSSIISITMGIEKK